MCKSVFCSAARNWRGSSALSLRLSGRGAFSHLSSLPPSLPGTLRELCLFLCLFLCVFLCVFPRAFAALRIIRRCIKLVSLRALGSGLCTCRLSVPARPGRCWTELAETPLSSCGKSQFIHRTSYSFHTPPVQHLLAGSFLITSFFWSEGDLCVQAKVQVVDIFSSWVLMEQLVLFTQMRLFFNPRIGCCIDQPFIPRFFAHGNLQIA